MSGTSFEQAFPDFELAFVLCARVRVCICIHERLLVFLCVFVSVTVFYFTTFILRMYVCWHLCCSSRPLPHRPLPHAPSSRAPSSPLHSIFECLWFAWM